MASYFGTKLGDAIAFGVVFWGPRFSTSIVGDVTGGGKALQCRADHSTSRGQYGRVFGQQVDLVNGMVGLITTAIESKSLSEEIRSRVKPQATLPSGLSSAMLEVLMCIGYKQPVLQAEVDRIFGADKREPTKKLRELGLVDVAAGVDGRLRLITTEAFLRFIERFKMGSLEDFRVWTDQAASSGSAHALQREAVKEKMSM